MYPQKTQEAIAVALSNKFRAWVGSNAERAGQRLKTGDYFHISHIPKFKLSNTEQIFTIGSSHRLLSLVFHSLLMASASKPTNSKVGMQKPAGAAVYNWAHLAVEPSTSIQFIR
jgi:hypothetical protein